MDLNVIVGSIFFVVFIILVVVGNRLVRNSTLEKLEALPEEKTLFEEDGVKVEECLRGKGIKTIYRNNHIRLTNKRIIVAQKPWFGKQHFLRQVINYRDVGPEAQVAGGIFLNTPTTKQGFFTFYTTPQQITEEQVGDKTVLKITVPLKNPGLLQAPRILLYTNNISAYQVIK
jgi:hypothetical protein